MGVPKIRTTWTSERMHRTASLVRWGHFGQPILLFPTAGGDCEEVERMHLIHALRPFLETGAIKVYSCDSIAGRALLTQEGSPQHRMWLQDQFHRYIRHEVLPAIHADCQSDTIPVWTAGASIGAFHAAAAVCRFPDVFHRAIAMSGTYDLARFFGAPAHAFTHHFFVSSPVHFVPTLGGPHLDVLRQRFILLLSGEGRAEDIGESWNLASILGRQGIPNRVDSWGRDWPHDWQTWRAMLPTTLHHWLTREQSVGR